MLLFSRLLATWFVPLLIVLLFDNSCSGMWTTLWSRCSGDSRKHFQIDILTSIGGDYVATSTKAINPEDICEPNHFISGTCSRGVIAAMAPLFIAKLSIAAFIRPALKIIKWEFLPLGFKRTLLKHVLRRAVDETKPESIKLDNEMSQLQTFVEIALIYGIHIPLILPLTWVAVLSSFVCHHVGVSVYGMRETRRKDGKPSMWYLAFSFVASQALAGWVFVDAEIGGKWGQLVVACGALCSMLVLASLFQMKCVKAGRTGGTASETMPTRVRMRPQAVEMVPSERKCVETLNPVYGLDTEKHMYP